MKKTLAVVFLAMALLTLVGCTANDRAKNFGGTLTVELPQGQKLVNATWKDAELWYLTRPMRDGEVAETFTFKEESSFGVMEGTVVFVEKR